MMTENADKKREQIHLLCMDEMVPKDHLLLYQKSTEKSLKNRTFQCFNTRKIHDICRGLCLQSEGCCLSSNLLYFGYIVLLVVSI